MVLDAVMEETPPWLFADHDAKPFASETKTFPAPGDPPSISIVPVNTVLPPTFNLPAIPAPPATINAPVVVEVEAVVAPTFNSLAIPTPPLTINAPVVDEVEAVVFGNVKAPMILVSVVAELPIKVVFDPNPTVPAVPLYPESTISLLSPSAKGRTSYPIKTLFRPLEFAVVPVEIRLPAFEPMNIFFAPVVVL